MSLDSANHNEARDEELARLRREAEGRSGRIRSALGLLIAPACMLSAWWMAADITTVRQVGWIVFVASMAVAVISHFPFARMRKRLDPVCEILIAPYSEGLTPSERNREVRYLFSRFTAEDFRTHQKMHLWGTVYATALFSIIGYAIARAGLFLSTRI